MINYLLNIFGVESCHKMIENIYLGDERCSQDQSFMKQENIKVVVNCSRHLDFYIQDGYKYRIPVDDNFSYASIQIMYTYIIKLVPIINNHVDKGEAILIHCRAGIQRSATFLTALFMYRYNLSKKKAMEFVKYKRPITFLPGSNFGLSLDLYEEYLLHTNRPYQETKPTHLEPHPTIQPPPRR